MSARYRLGVDIGGTFTDATLIDERSGAASTAKASTTSSRRRATSSTSATRRP